VTFPVPAIYTSEATDMARDNAKRATSPPSFFFARARGIALAAEYFTDARLGGYKEVAAKHRHRFQNALFGQVMAAFEWCIKDYFAQVIDATDLFDAAVEAADWIRLDKSRLLAQRESTASIGAMLVHPTLGWHDPREVNARYRVVFGAQPIANDEIRPLEQLWLLRHSVAHNGGLVTHHDAYRMGASHLANQTARIDANYIAQAEELLGRIIARLHHPVGEKVLERWIRSRSIGVWVLERQEFSKLRLITTAEPGRHRDLPEITQEHWEADRERLG
jgi:hypothetical protein